MARVEWDELFVRLLDSQTGQLLREHVRQKSGYRIQSEDHSKRTPLRVSQPLWRAGRARAVAHLLNLPLEARFLRELSLGQTAIFMVWFPMLELIGLTPVLERKLEGLSPHRRPLPTWMCYYKPNNRSLAVNLKDATIWEFSLFDGDSSLCSLTAS